MPNGAVPQLFQMDEYRARLRKTRQAMQRMNIDVLVVTEPSNMFYLSGYDAWSFYVPQAVVVHLDDELPIWIGRAQDANCARLTTYLPESRILTYGDEFVQSATSHPMQVIASILEARGWGAMTIGIEMDAPYYTARCHDVLVHSLPNARFKDAELLVNWVRAIKSSSRDSIPEAGRRDRVANDAESCRRR